MKSSGLNLIDSGVFYLIALISNKIGTITQTSPKVTPKPNNTGSSGQFFPPDKNSGKL